jgi:hypothetical protein
MCQPDPGPAIISPTIDESQFLSARDKNRQISLSIVARKKVSGKSRHKF